ncbi:MAG: GDYXXLXY domain-containing protein [Proteobacteria bacterium]|nr:GDYXXLXY domain-containing protein [Pseudomonadota bacterium]
MHTLASNPWPTRIALGGAALGGLGLIMWVASQWAGWGLPLRFGLAQAVLALGLLGAAVTTGRQAFALLGWLAIGALFALIGQTYQTGADPWQLFALWTLLALPVALAARSDALWSGWALVAAVAVARWLSTRSGLIFSDAPPPLSALVAALLLAAIWLAVGPLARRWTGAGRWAPRVASVAMLLVLAGMGVMALVDARSMTLPLTWLVALLAVAVLAAALTRAPWQDAGQLAATALAALVLLVAWAAVRLLKWGASDPISALLLLGVLAAVLLALLAWALLRWQARRADATTAIWPVAALTALGAWLAAVPLLAGLGLALGAAFRSSFWLVGAVLWVGAVAVLRRPGLTRFVEQVMVPVLLAGGVALAVGASTDGPAERGAAVGLAATLVAAALLPQPWLRGVLGALALVAAQIMLGGRLVDGAGWAETTLLLAWLLATPLHRHPRWQPVALGWIVAWLGLVMWSGGPTLLVAGVAGEMGDGWSMWTVVGVAHKLSAALAVVAAVLLWRMLPALRGLRAAVVAAVLVALAAAVPALGGVLLVLVLGWLHGTRSLVALATLAALWLVGTLYYELHWPLAHKGLALAVAGTLLVASVWRPRAQWQAPRGVRPMALLLGALAATLALANTTIWRQQQIVAQGRTVYVALAPADPRSLLAGDYMRLAFELPEAVFSTPGATRVRARVDAQGVATVTAVLAPGAVVGAGEVALPLRRRLSRGRGPVLVTDAYYFPEGQAARFASARYGVLRVLPDGRALLTGLADAQRRPL